MLWPISCNRTGTVTQQANTIPGLYLNDALHQILLSQGVSAVYNLLQHSRKNNLWRETGGNTGTVGENTGSVTPRDQSLDRMSGHM